MALVAVAYPACPLNVAAKRIYEVRMTDHATFSTPQLFKRHARNTFAQYFLPSTKGDYALATEGR